MARELIIKVNGLKELDAALLELGSKNAAAIARSMANAGAQVTRAQAQRNVPVADKIHYLYAGKKGTTTGRTRTAILPGEVQRNIIVLKVKEGKTDYLAEYAVTVRHKGKGVTGIPYAVGIFLEKGTVKMAPRPFIGPALKQTIDSAVNAMKEKGRERIFAIANKVGRGYKK